MVIYPVWPVFGLLKTAEIPPCWGIWVANLKITVKCLLWLVFLEDSDRVLSIYRMSFKYRRESCCFEEFASKNKSPEKKLRIPSVWCVFCVQKKINSALPSYCRAILWNVKEYQSHNCLCTAISLFYFFWVHSVHWTRPRSFWQKVKYT